jgi:hypothetical protein
MRIIGASLTHNYSVPLRLGRPICPASGLWSSTAGAVYGSAASESGVVTLVGVSCMMPPLEMGDQRIRMSMCRPGR